MQVRERIAWISTAILAFLVLGSFAGNGTGPLGLGVMHGTFWAFLIVFGIVVLLLASHPPRPRPKPVPPAEGTALPRSERGE